MKRKICGVREVIIRWKIESGREGKRKRKVEIWVWINNCRFDELRHLVTDAVEKIFRIC